MRGFGGDVAQQVEPREQVRIVCRPALQLSNAPDELGEDVPDNLPRPFVFTYAPHSATR